MPINLKLPMESFGMLEGSGVLLYRLQRVKLKRFLLGLAFLDENDIGELGIILFESRCKQRG